MKTSSRCQWSPPAAPQTVGVGLSELQAPAADGLVGDDHPTLEHQLLHLAVAERETEVQPHAVRDDLDRVAMALVRHALHDRPLPAAPTRRSSHRSANVTAPPAALLHAFQQVNPQISDLDRQDICGTQGKAVRARGHFPSENAALKCVCMALMSLDQTGKGRRRWTMRWKAPLNAFQIAFEGRLTPTISH